MKVKCINSAATSGLLIVGNIYEVISTLSNAQGDFYTLKGVANDWHADRFVKVEAKTAMKVKGSVPAKVSSTLDMPKTDTTRDMEEDRLWKLLEPHVEAGYCKCGIAKIQCNYHRVEVAPAPTWKFIKT